MEFSPRLVQDILANLHFLHKSTVRLLQFEHVLVQTWTQLSELLAPPDQTHKLEITCSAFPLVIVNVLANETAAPENDTLTYSQVLRFIENGPNKDFLSDYGAKVLQIRNFLQEKHEIERVPGLLRRAYSQILSSFLDLVLLRANSLENAERKITDFCCRCFLYEANHAETPGFQLENGDADTEKLMLLIDTYNPLDSEKPFPSLFPVPLKSASTQPLHLKCSDPYFFKLYQLFLQLFLHKLGSETHEDTWPYVNVMLMLYKKNTGAEAFEPVDEFQMDARIMDFLCGSESVPGIISCALRDYALEVLLMDTNGKNRTESINHAWVAESSTSPESSLSQNFTKHELVALVADFETVVSTLIEYDPHIDASLPMAFRNYIFLAYQEFPDLPVLEDFRFVDTVVNTIAQVVDYVALDDYSEHDTIGAILLCIGNIQTTLLEILTLLTLLMRLAISETSNALAFASNCLRNWNRKTLVASQLRLIYEEEYVPRIQSKLLRTSLLKWRLKSSTFRQLLSEASHYCEKKQLSYHFNKRWIRAMLRSIEMNNSIVHFHLAKFLGVWKTNLNQYLEMALALNSHYDSVCKARCFRLWVLKFEKVNDLDMAATKLGDQIRMGVDNLLKKRAWVYWKLKLNQPLANTELGATSLSEKLSTLNQKYRSFLLRKYFNILVSRSANQNALAVFQSTRNRFLKQRFFGVLQNKTQLSNVRDIVTQERNLSLKRSAFECWYDQVRSKIMADNKSRQSLLQRYWKYWRLKEAEINFNDARATKLMNGYLKKWLLRFKSSSVVEKTDIVTMHMAFSLWKDRITKVSNDDELAGVTQRRSTIGESFEVWQSKMATNHEMAAVADLNFQRKFFNKIWTSHSKIKDQYFKAEGFLGHSHSFVDRLDLKGSLKKWQDVYLTRYEREASHALTYFQQEVRNVGVLSVFFKHWKRKHQQLKKHQVLLEKNLLFFNNTNILKSEFLMHWIDVSREKHSAMEQSADFYRTLLHKKFLLVWYEKYVTKSRYLSDIADDLVNKREYNQMVELLRKWNLTFTKNVKRNQQTCEMFIEKWERNNLKSLFELWVFKTRKKLVVVEEYAEANATFGSNTSPLSRKFIGSGASLEYLDGESYLYTPVKKQVARLPFTPAKLSTSPTRLQETNQKMKSTKMDALTNRYKLAKGEPKDYKPKLYRSDSTVLPPPSSASSPAARLPIRPPPAPRFETYTDQNPVPEATSSPEVSVISGTATDDRVLATAKRLQRIKPVVIPQSSPTSEIRYSPISKLRERLQLRTGTIKSPSDVF